MRHCQPEVRRQKLDQSGERLARLRYVSMANSHAPLLSLELAIGWPAQSRGVWGICMNGPLGSWICRSSRGLRPSHFHVAKDARTGSARAPMTRRALIILVCSPTGQVCRLGCRMNTARIRTNYSWKNSLPCSLVVSDRLSSRPPLPAAGRCLINVPA